MTSSVDSKTRSSIKPGLIEGFFGRSWSWSDRQRMVQFLADYGYDFYTYAPKNDPALRREWQRPWATETARSVHDLRAYSAGRGLQFGIGLSLFDIYHESDSRNRQHVHNKITELNELDPDVLCILFDDMRGDLPGLAEQQTRWVDEIVSTSNARRFIFCPTYYTTDPILEKVFGQRPKGYWETLGRQLDPKVDFFWTGPRVCSATYPLDDVSMIGEKLRRKPVIWDNYPVNDGAIKSGFLHLRGADASHADLPGNVAGVCGNPMNQPLLSRLALYSLPRVLAAQPDYNPLTCMHQACDALLSPELAAALKDDCSLFQDVGLIGLSDEQKKTLVNKYRQLAQVSPDQGAEEVIDWLEGGYAFDPACLTD